MSVLVVLLMLSCQPRECTWSAEYPDRDGDGFGQQTAVWKCRVRPTAAVAGTDCDDTDAQVNPGAEEGSCNSRDLDCDGFYRACDGDWFADQDQDGYGVPPAVPGAAGQRGLSSRSDDCDDLDPTVSPGAVEACDGIDNDCDREIDEATNTSPVWYADADGDGAGDVRERVRGCTAPSGYVDNDADCNDADASVTDEAEACGCDDGIDNDGDGRVDCEDGECASSPLCWEQDCADGRDSDQDGVWDCFDEDCWGSAACTEPLLYASVHGGVYHRQYSGRNEFTHIHGRCRERTRQHAATVVGEELFGTVRRFWPTDAQSTVCTWRVSSVRREMWDTHYSCEDGLTFSSSSTGGSVYRAGFTLQPDCPFSVSSDAVLPEQVDLLGEWGGVLTADGGACAHGWLVPQPAAAISSSWEDNYRGHHGSFRRRGARLTSSGQLASGQPYPVGQCR